MEGGDMTSEEVIELFNFWDNTEYGQNFLRQCIDRWWEKEKAESELIGARQAMAELSRREFLDQEKEEKTGKGEKFYWITVNPRKEVETSVFAAAIHKMYSKKWIENVMYIFEKAGNQHSHGLIKTMYPYARAKKELGNTVKDICNVNIPACFKFVQILDEKVALQKLRYMMGVKTTKKMAHVAESKVWRKENNFEEYYHRGSLTLLAPSETEPTAELNVGPSTGVEAFDNVEEIILPEF